MLPVIARRHDRPSRAWTLSDRCFLPGLLLPLILASLMYGEAPEPHFGRRREHAERLRQIQVGMPASGALRLLGKPDERRRPKFPLREGQVFWCYGVVSKGTLPTLGSILVNEDGTIASVSGAAAPEVDAISVSEQKLRHILSTMDVIGPVEAQRYDPLAMIRTVNDLQALGKEGAIQAIREYLRVIPDTSSLRVDNLRLVLRLLFEADDDNPPKVMFGATSPPAPSESELKQQLPHFPLVVCNDIPLMVITGYRLFGRQVPVEFYVDYYAEHGVLRNQPLAPTDNLGELLKIMERAPWWRIYKGDPAAGRFNMEIQLLRLARTVRAVDEREWCNLSPASVHEQWQRARPALSRAHIRWRADSNSYVARAK